MKAWKKFLGVSWRAIVCTGLSLCSVAGVADEGSRAAMAGSKPNIVFIMADDLGWGDLSAYGHYEIETPNLDELAADGKLFTNFYAMSPVCSPSRAGILTGRFPARHRVHGHFAGSEHNEARGMPDWLDPSAPSFARRLQDGGYATAHFGKWHLSLPSGEGAPPPTEYGFDVSRAYLGAGPSLPIEREGNPDFRAQSTKAIVDETIDFVRTHRDRPFYVSVWTLIPHTVLNPTEEQMAPFIEKYAPDIPGHPHAGAKAVYYATVRDLDRQVGRLMEALEKMGLKEETLVIFSSDNGPETIHIDGASHSGIGSTGPFRGRKRSLYEGGIRVPFIVSWPGVIPKGRVDRESVLAGVDFMPTFCELAGVEPPSGEAASDGESMLGALGAGPKERQKPLFWEFHYEIPFGHVIHKSPFTALRDGDWKLLTNPGGERTKLYDLANDPTELDDLSRRELGVAKELKGKLRDLRRPMPEAPISENAGTNAYPWPE